MAIDLSGRENFEIESYRARMRTNPELFANNPELVAAVNSEYARRGLGRPAPASNVDADLDASATPLTPEAEVRSAAVAAEKARLREGVPAEFQARLPGETMDEYGARYGASIRAGFDASDAAYAARKKAGYKHPDRVQMEAEWRANNPDPMSTTFVRKDEGSAYAPMTNFQPGATVMVDGVEVPAVDLGDGQLRYRLGDVKRAQEAAQEAKWLAGHRQMVADEKERLGLHLPVMLRSPEQVENLHRQRDAESASAAARERSRAYQIAHANDPKTPYEQKLADRRARLSSMAHLAGGSQNIHSGNRSFFNALAMLEGVQPDQMDAQQRAMMQMMPMDPVRAQVEARQLDMAARLAGDAVTGALAGQGTAGAQDEAMRMQRMRAGQEWFETWHAKNVGWRGGPYTPARQQQVIEYLVSVYRIDPAAAAAIAQSQPTTEAEDPAAPTPSGIPDDAGAMPPVSL